MLMRVRKRAVVFTLPGVLVGVCLHVLLYWPAEVGAEEIRTREIQLEQIRTAGFQETETPPDELSSVEIEPYQYSPPPALNDGIEVGDLRAAGFDVAAIETLMAKARRRADAGGYQDIHSLLVYKDGHLLLEEYFTGSDDYIDFENGIQRIKRPAVEWNRDKKQYVASVNKALTATLVGIAFQQLQMQVEQKLSASLPDYKTCFEDPHNAAISWRDMLTMQSGFVWDEWTGDDLKSLWQSQDFTQFLLARNNNGAESEWRYNSAVPNVLLRALQNELGTPVREWADRAFYQRLGISDYRWESQPGGYPEGSARMFMRPRDMLKIGITYLNDGVWRGQQVIPADWVNSVSSVQTSSESGDYSYFFWIRELSGIRYLSADGDGGQYINIFPQQNMVIVITQGNYSQWPLYVEQSVDMMSNYIFPAFEVEAN